jgi:hypothetical protein
MSRSDIDEILRRIDTLDEHIAEFVPSTPRTLEFRADLAGLLVVSIAASYETCVKETLNTYAARHHAAFGLFTQNQFRRLNSRISVSDLYGYARTFNNDVHHRFGELMKARKKRVELRTGKDITAAYGLVLSWRHDYAHAGVRNTTIEEALQTHRLAKRVLYSFDDAFSGA